MLSTSEEIDQLKQLLLSDEDNNKLIAFEIIKGKPEWVVPLKRALCITAYVPVKFREHIEGAAHLLLSEHLSEQALYDLQNEIIILDYALYKFKFEDGWSTYDNPLRKYYAIHKKSIEHYLALFKINPITYAQVYNVLASRIQKEWDNYKEALYIYEKAIELHPNNTQASFGCAMIIHVYYIKRGKRLTDTELVLKYYLSAYKSKKNISVYRNAAMLMKDVDDTDRACYYFEEGLKECPNDISLLNNYANLLMEFYANYEKAYELASKGLKIAPLDSSLLDTMGHIEMEGYHRYEKAKICFEKALRHDNECHYAHTGLGDLYGRMGDLKQAAYHYHKGLHTGIQYTSREVFEIIEKLEKMVVFYSEQLKDAGKAVYYQLKLNRLKSCKKG